MRQSLVASLMVTGVGALWGLYWIPLRALEGVSAAGPWSTFWVLVPACIVLAPSAVRARKQIRDSGRIAIASTALGGASFVLYSDGLLYGQVAVVILLFYLTPIWSTLISRYWLGWPVSRRRYIAIALGLIGIAVVLQSGGGGLPRPHALGDWLGLASGLLWAVSSVGINKHSRTGPVETNFIFCAGAVAAALILALILGWNTPPQMSSGHYGVALGWTLLIGILWWAVALAAFLRAAQILEPGRVGILLMSEAVVGAISAALFANEPFGVPMMIGTMLIVIAGLLEAIPDRRTRRP